MSNNLTVTPESAAAIDTTTLQTYIHAAVESLEAIKTDPSISAIAAAARSHVSGVTPLDSNVDREGQRLSLQVITALKAAKQLVETGKATIKDPEITLELISNWINDLSMRSPARIYNVSQTLKDILHSIQLA